MLIFGYSQYLYCPMITNVNWELNRHGICAGLDSHEISIRRVYHFPFEFSWDLILNVHSFFLWGWGFITITGEILPKMVTEFKWAFLIIIGDLMASPHAHTYLSRNVIYMRNCEHLCDKLRIVYIFLSTTVHWKAALFTNAWPNEISHLQHITTQSQNWEWFTFFQLRSRS